MESNNGKLELKPDFYDEHAETGFVSDEGQYSEDQECDSMTDDDLYLSDTLYSTKDPAALEEPSAIEAETSTLEGDTQIIGDSFKCEYDSSMDDSLYFSKDTEPEKPDSEAKQPLPADPQSFTDPNIRTLMATKMAELIALKKASSGKDEDLHTEADIAEEMIHTFGNTDNDISRLNSDYGPVDLSYPLELIPLELNVTAAQHEVITYPCVAGELLEIVAGPGSGKTKTLIARISYMINSGITPNEILVLSMTNRAVDALRTALAQLVGSDFAASVNIYTFHGFCNKLLLEHGKDFGLDPSWQIIEENGWRTLNSMVEVRNIYSLQKAVNEARTSQDVAAIARKFKISLKSLQKVLRTLKQSHMKTYGDVASEAIQLMTENPALLNNFKCVVVDEFQDVYPAILEMAVAISKGKHLTIAGDPQQAIYEFLAVTKVK